MSNYESQRENTTNNEQPPRRKKRKKRGSGCLSFLIYILFVAGVSFALSALAITVANDMFGLVQDDTPVMMSLEEGAAVDEVAVVLKDHQLIDHKWAFKLYCKLKHVETFSTGEFELASNMDYGQLISELRRANQKTETVTLTIPEGYNIQQIAELLESSRVCGKKMCPWSRIAWKVICSPIPMSFISTSVRSAPSIRCLTTSIRSIQMRCVS